MSTGFNLPVRKVAGSGTPASSTGAQLTSSFAPATTSTNNSEETNINNDPSKFSILGEPLPESASHELGPPLGISVAAVIAAGVVKANQSDDVDRQMNNTSSKVPFQLPIRKVNEQGKDDGGVDMSASWAVVS